MIFGSSLRFWLVFLASLCAAKKGNRNSENPIIQTNFTADPAPLVYHGKVYLYTSHDERRCCRLQDGQLEAIHLHGHGELDRPRNGGFS